MRSRRIVRYALLGVALLTLYGCPPTRWYETYRYDGEDPFDLLALYELLAARPEGLTRIRDTTELSLLDSVTGTNYLFVGDRPYYGEAAVTGLLDYVERGNNAFLAANLVPEDLAYHLFGDDCYYAEDFDEGYYAVNPRFREVLLDTAVAYRYPSGDSFQLVHIRYWQPTGVNMAVVNDQLLCDDALDNEVLGVLDTAGVNFLRLGWGEGNFYFHSNPVYFTNWFVLDSLQYRYPETSLAAIADGPVFWDEYHRRYRTPPGAGSNNSAAQRNYTGGRNLLSGNETLRYIQERRALAFAWYTLLAGVLLFVVFRGRRRQRIIPIIPPRANSSRRFIDTISRLVQQKGNHAALAQRELVSLRFHLNTHRGIRWKEGEAAPADLAERLGLAPQVVDRALVQIRVVTGSKSLEEGDLLRFYRSIEPLYGS